MNNIIYLDDYRKAKKPLTAQEKAEKIERIRASLKRLATLMEERK